MAMKKIFYVLLAVLLMGPGGGAGIGVALAENPLLEDAIALHDDGRDGDTKAVAEAITLFERIIDAEPQNAKAIAYLGSSYAISARDSKEVADKMRYTNRGLRFLDQAVTLAPNDFAVRVIRANVANNLPELFGRQATAIEDGLVLDKMFSAAQSPAQISAMAPAMIRIYEILGDIAPDQGDWESKAAEARNLLKG